MEQMTSDQIPEQPLEQISEQIPEQVPEAPIRRRRERPQKRSGLTVPAFLTQLGRDVRWYYDVRLWLPLVLVLVTLAACTGSSMAERTTQEKYEAIIQTMEEDARREQEQAQAEITEPTAAPIDPEAEALAVLADSVGAGRSRNVKTVIMWVAINRSENAIEGHGKPLLEEIAMPHQWQGYDPTISYFPDTYEIAVEVLETRDSGRLRPLDSDMLWMVLNDDGSVTLRNMFKNNGTNQWREKTVK